MYQNIANVCTFPYEVIIVSLLHVILVKLKYII